MFQSRGFRISENRNISPNQSIKVVFMNSVPIKFSLVVIFFVCIFFYFFSNFLSEKIDNTANIQAIQNAEAVVEWAKEHLPNTGVLKEGKDGFVYVKIDDGYINQLYPLLELQEYRKPAYFRRPNAPGAHISVFYVSERSHTGKIKEIGKKISFKIERIEAVPPNSPEYIVLKVSSPELEALRKKYGLKPHLKDHSFHITIAKKKHRGIHSKPPNVSPTTQ